MSGQMVVNFKMIAANYISTWFTIDLLTCIPVQLIQDYIITDQRNSSNIKLARLARLPRIYKVLRILRLTKIIKLYKQK